MLFAAVHDSAFARNRHADAVAPSRLLGDEPTSLTHRHGNELGRPMPPGATTVVGFMGRAMNWHRQASPTQQPPL